MKYTYTLQEDDYLQFQLFTASQSTKTRRRKIVGWTLATSASIFALIYNATTNNSELVIFFSITTALLVLLYPTYFKWKFKKHCQRFIRENYAGRVGTEESIDFQEKQLFLKDVSGEGKVKHNELESVHELPNHFFLRMSNGNSLIIPKKIENTQGIANEIEKLGLEKFIFLNWKW